MSAGRKAVIFCSASFDIDPKYNVLARDIVKGLCAQGYGIVSGGTIKGTMKVVAETARDCRAFNRGVLPSFMKGLEYPGMTETLWTSSMSERKEAMRKETCLALALPGGIGTMDELIETLTLAKMGIYKGKIIAVNYDGFYDTVVAMLDHFVDTGMLDRRSRALISFPCSVEETLALTAPQD